MSATKALQLHGWERVDSPEDEYLVMRMRVASGWLYLVDGQGPAFVPEPGLYQQER